MGAGESKGYEMTDRQFNDGAEDESGDLTLESIERVAATCSTFFGSRLNWLIARVRELEAAQAVPEGADLPRKAFICRSCHGVYADAPVTQCDCSVEEATEFYEGRIVAVDAQPLGWVKRHVNGGKVSHSFTDNPVHVAEWAARGVTLTPVFDHPASPKAEPECAPRGGDIAAGRFHFRPGYGWMETKMLPAGSPDVVTLYHEAGWPATRASAAPELWALRSGGHVEAAPTKFAAEWEAKRTGEEVIPWPGTPDAHERSLDDGMRWEMVPRTSVAAARMIIEGGGQA